MTLLLTVGSILAAIVPMFTFLAVVWWLDRYDREPVGLLTITFGWGAVPAVVLALVGSVALNQVVVAFGIATGLDPALTSLAGPVFVAPIVEEPAKALILLFLMFNRNFDDMTDGFVYGAASGLGFGMTENLIYFLDATGNATDWGFTVLIRTFYSAVMHATATSIVGAALGFGRFRAPGVLVISGLVGYLLAVAIHALWNGLIGAGLFLADLAVFPIEVLVVFLVFQVCLLEESIIIRRELTEEARRGTLPSDHPQKLASWVSRHSRRWIPAGVDHHTYVRLATRLAVRRNQVRRLGQRASRFYHEDVERLRGAVRKLLAHST